MSTQMANNNNNNTDSTHPRSAIWPAEMFDSSPTHASGGGPPRHVAAPELLHYVGGVVGVVGELNSSAIPTTVELGRGAVAAAARDARYHVAWEDRSTGSYYRYNAGVQQDRGGGGEGFRWYENVKVRDAESGFEAKYTAEEKYQQVPHDDDDDAVNHDDHVIDHDHDHDHHDYDYGYGDADAVADYDDHDGDEW